MTKEEALRLMETYGSTYKKGEYMKVLDAFEASVREATLEEMVSTNLKGDDKERVRVYFDPGVVINLTEGKTTVAPRHNEQSIREDERKNTLEEVFSFIEREVGRDYINVYGGEPARDEIFQLKDLKAKLSDKKENTNGK